VEADGCKRPTECRQEEGRTDGPKQEGGMHRECELSAVGRGLAGLKGFCGVMKIYRGGCVYVLGGGVQNLALFGAERQKGHHGYG
jgi:hypothetical protein